MGTLAGYIAAICISVAATYLNGRLGFEPSVRGAKPAALISPAYSHSFHLAFGFAFVYKDVWPKKGDPQKEKRMASKKKGGKSLKKAKALAHTKPLKATGGDVLKLKPW
jgi:hypothetical protein